MNRYDSMISIDLDDFPKTSPAFIVGGSVRDLLLNRKPKDIDIAVSGNPKRYAHEISDAKGGVPIKIGKEKQAVYRIVCGETTYDITPLNGDAIDEDLRRRDFTINAMAVDLGDGSIIDVTTGLDDLKSGTIRMVSESAFRNDPLRLLRAYRIGAELDFNIEPDTVSAIRRRVDLIRNPAGERIRAELFRLMDTSISARYIERMADVGLLFALFPELSPLKDCLQNEYHEYNAFEHTISAYTKLEMLLNDSETFSLFFPYNTGRSLKISKYLLKYAVLIHDIGKPTTKTKDRNGRIHFYGHAHAGAEMSLDIAGRLKLSRFENETAYSIIRNHIRPLLLYIAHLQNSLSEKGIVRFFMKAGELTPYILLHALADHLGKGKKDVLSTAKYHEFLAGMIHDYYSRYEPIQSAQPLLTGHDLIREFGLRPGPVFKEILTRVEESRYSGEICNRKAALALVKKYIENHVGFEETHQKSPES